MRHNKINNLVMVLNLFVYYNENLFITFKLYLFCVQKIVRKRKFSKDNFLPFLIAVLLWCNIVVVLWYKLNKESFSFYIFIGFAPAFISYF